jgi:Learning-associated protein
LIVDEFIQEKKAELATDSKKRKNIKTMKVINANTGKEHNYNTRTLKDEFNTYPPWLNVGNHKRKIKRKKTAMKKNQFYTGSIHIGIAN